MLVFHVGFLYCNVSSNRVCIYMTAPLLMLCYYDQRYSSRVVVIWQDFSFPEDKRNTIACHSNLGIKILPNGLLFERQKYHSDRNNIHARFFFICLSTVGGGFCPRRPRVRSGRKKSILKHFVSSTQLLGVSTTRQKKQRKKSAA